MKLDFFYYCCCLEQIGQQSIAFGMKFDAKGIVDCYEKDLQILPYGQRRDIDFKMIEGDFKVFEGKWSVEQVRVLPLFCFISASSLHASHLKVLLFLLLVFWLWLFIESLHNLLRVLKFYFLS